MRNFISVAPGHVLQPVSSGLAQASFSSLGADSDRECRDPSGWQTTALVTRGTRLDVKTSQVHSAQQPSSHGAWKRFNRRLLGFFAGTPGDSR